MKNPMMWESFWACKHFLQKAIEQNYREQRLDVETIIKTVSSEFDVNTINQILAATVKDWDHRYSLENRMWAKMIQGNQPEEVWVEVTARTFPLESHPGLVNLLIDAWRANQNPSEKKMFALPVCWEVFGVVRIEASSLEEAVDMFERDKRDIPLPDRPGYTENSFNLASDDLEYLRAFNERWKGEEADVGF